MDKVRCHPGYEDFKNQNLESFFYRVSRKDVIMINTQLIARRIRESGVYCEIHPWDQDEKILRNFKPSGIVLSGGPESVNLEDPPVVADFLFELSVPILGICYGMQTMAKQLGGLVEASTEREYGYAEVNPSE